MYVFVTVTMAAPGFVQAAGFVFAPRRPKRKYDTPVATWTHDQAIIDGMSSGHSASTLKLTHGSTYLEMLVKYQKELIDEEEHLQQLQNRIRVFPPEMTTIDRISIADVETDIKKLRTLVENLQHNADLNLLQKTEHRSEKNIFEIIDKRDPIYVEDDERRIHAIYFHKPTKIMATGHVFIPRLGVTFAELGIRPVYFYAPTDPMYPDIQNAYLKRFY